MFWLQRQVNQVYYSIISPRTRTLENSPAINRWDRVLPGKQEVREADG